MFKFLLVLAVGVAIGYSVGWKDARQHDKNAVDRLVERVGGETRARMGNDVDTRYQAGDSR